MTKPPYKMVFEVCGEVNQVKRMLVVISAISELDEKLKVKITSRMCEKCGINLKPEELWFSSKDGKYRCPQCAEIKYIKDEKRIT